MALLTKKLFNGREVKREVSFKGGSNITFGALYEATFWLHENGYKEGSLSHPEPIGFVKGSYDLPLKWHNLTKTDKAKLAGVMVSENFREGDVKVIFFED